MLTSMVPLVSRILANGSAFNPISKNLSLLSASMASAAIVSHGPRGFCGGAGSGLGSGSARAGLNRLSPSCDSSAIGEDSSSAPAAALLLGGPKRNGRSAVKQTGRNSPRFSELHDWASKARMHARTDAKAISEEEVRHTERAAQLTADGGAVIVLVVQDDSQASRGVQRDVRYDEGSDLRGTLEVDGRGGRAFLRAIAIGIMNAGVHQADARSDREIGRLAAVQRKEEASRDSQRRRVVFERAAQQRIDV